MSFGSAFDVFYGRLSPYRCPFKLVGALREYKALGLSPRRMAAELKSEFGFEAKPEEVEGALCDSGILSLIDSRIRFDVLLGKYGEKLNAMHAVLGDLRKATTEFDVEKIIAEGCIRALGYGRVVVYDVLPDGVIKSRWWKKSDGGIEDGSASDRPLPEATPNLGIFPGNGNVFVFETMNPEVTIQPEDTKILETIVRVGTAAKQKIRSEHRERIEQTAEKMRILFSNRAPDEIRTIQAFLICLLVGLGGNRAIFLRWLKREKKFVGIFGVGSLSREEHREAMKRLKPGMTVSDIFSLVQGRTDPDKALNEVVCGATITEEIPTAIVVRGGKAYDCEDNALGPLPESVARFAERIDASDFVLVPIRTSRTTYGLLFMDNPWDRSDIDVEAVKRLGRSFISHLVSLKRQEEIREDAVQSVVWSKDQIEALKVLQLWQAVVKSSENQTDARRILEDRYYEILEAESSAAGTPQELRALIEKGVRRLLMPERMWSIEVDEASTAFLNLKEANIIIEGALLESLRHFCVEIAGVPPAIKYLHRYQISIKIIERSLIIEYHTGGDDKFSFNEWAELGEALIKRVAQQRRDAGLEGIVTFNVRGKQIEIRML